FILFYHSLIGHKEISFIYPAIPLFIFSASAGLCQFLFKFPQFTKPLILVELATCILVFCSTFIPFLARPSAIMRLEQVAARQKDICGLALIDVPSSLFQTGGYSVLKPNIPLYRLADPSKIDPNDTRYSHVLANRYFHYLFPAADEILCKGGGTLCLYRVRSHCTGTPDFNQATMDLQKSYPMLENLQ
ncbi:MAG: hypothetical protein ABF535_08980, partial [Acetobacter sp.]